MTSIEEYIADYKKQAGICAAIDYNDKATVKANNKAVTRMYVIIEAVKSRFGTEGINTFAALLDISANDCNLWAAVQLLERAKLDQSATAKALNIIKSAARNNSGLQMWLKDYQAKTT